MSIGGHLSSYYNLDLITKKYNQAKLFELTFKMFQDFGIDSNGCEFKHVNHYLEANDLQLVWIIGVDKQVELKCLQSYERMKFMILLEYYGDEISLSFNFISTTLNLKDLGIKVGDLFEEKWAEDIN